MPKRQYEHWKPGERIMALARDCMAIANDYARQGYDLTVRQLYYQLVAADRIPNTLQSYKQIAGIIDRLRMAGMMDWNLIVDRTRRPGGGGGWDSPDQVVLSSADSYGIDLWEDQPRRVEIWVEKDALSGVISRVGYSENIAFFACRGYTSTSAMWAAARRFLAYWEAGQSVTILHLGDHDPSGIMTRDIRDRLELFLSVDWARDNFHRFESDPLYVRYADVVQDLANYVDGDPLEVRRIALNMDQVVQYNPPPNFAKPTDSRYAEYRSNYGEDSWELDALSPTVLAQLMTAEVQSLRDDELYQGRIARQEAERQILTDLVDRWDEVRRFLEES